MIVFVQKCRLVFIWSHMVVRIRKMLKWNPKDAWWACFRFLLKTSQLSSQLTDHKQYNDVNEGWPNDECTHYSQIHPQNTLVNDTQNWNAIGIKWLECDQQSLWRVNMSNFRHSQRTCPFQPARRNKIDFTGTEECCSPWGKFTSNFAFLERICSHQTPLLLTVSSIVVMLFAALQSERIYLSPILIDTAYMKRWSPALLLSVWNCN